MRDVGEGTPPVTIPEPLQDAPILPARMVNEYVYCPRLAYLEWVQGEWAESGDTVEGRYRHRRVSARAGDLPPSGEADPEDRIHARSITLSSDRLGLIAKLDLVEGEGNAVTPVDYKRGKRPHIAQGAYDPERVQVCAQGLLLQENGYTCEEGVLYFVESRERVRVPFDDELRSMTVDAIEGLRRTAAGGEIPHPLEDSPKCPRCSLVGICLPDEVNFLQREGESVRPLAVGRDEALPLYVQAHRAKVAKNGETLEITVDDQPQPSVRLLDVSQLVVMGNVYVTTPTLQEFMRREIPVTWHSFGGWFLGHTVGVGHKNVELRTAQYKASFDEKTCLRLAGGFVRAKVLNCRTLLRRNWRDEEKPEAVIEALKRDADAALEAEALQGLLGIEGIAAQKYFGRFAGLIKDVDGPEGFRFDFSRRNRRPPTDPVNSLLSLAYAMLTRTWAVTLAAVGFDPYRGFYHQPRYGRPALALDMMESFRPLVADSCVIQAINNGEVRPSDFIRAGGGVALTDEGRKRFIGTFERRLSQEVTHPVFEYRVSYRRLFEIQARLLGRFRLGEISEYPNFTTR